MKYEVNGKQYEVWSSKNQRIISKFVDREVYSNVTDMVEFILQNSYGDACGEAPFTNDDIENMYVDNSDRIEELNDYLEELNDELEELESEIEELESEIEELEDNLESTREEFEEEPYRIELRDDIKHYNKEIEEKSSKVKEKIDERSSLLSNIGGLENEVSDLESEQDEPNEVYCWYIVSPWLCDKLKDIGEVVIENESLWGRGACGQSISLDWVIGSICKNLEILEGQQYEWEV